MGTCCAAHLAAKVRDYAPDAENGAVTVTVIEDPYDVTPGPPGGFIACVSCGAPAEFTVSFFPKK